MSAIDEAIKAAAAAQAAAQAAAAAPVAGTAVANAAPMGMSMVAPVSNAPKLNMETVMTGQLNVDAWFKPKHLGMFIGDNKELVAEVIATITMKDGRGFIVKKGIKAGNPAQYFYTTDGVTCVSGGTWEAAVAKARSIDPKAYEYRCVDLPFDVVNPVMGRDIKTGVEKELYAAGTKLGYTTSTTNWKAWEEFYQDVAEANLMDQEVLVKVTCAPRSNKAGNEWGILEFELLGERGE